MANPKVFLTAPAGNIGSRTGMQLVERGQSISVLALERDVEQLPENVREAAEVHVGTMDNEQDIVDAGKGSSAMLLILPPVIDVEDVESAWQRFIDNSMAAIKANGIDRVVFISSQGVGEDAPLFLKLSYEVEELLRDAVPHVRSLRPGPLMETMVHEADPFSHGLYPAIVTDANKQVLTFTSCDDIGDICADLLSDDSWSGFEIQTLRGPDILSVNEVVERLSAVLGIDMAVMRITSAEFVDQLMQFGFARGSAQAIADVIERGSDLDYADDDTTHVCPTSLDEFIRAKVAPAVAALIL